MHVKNYHPQYGDYHDLSRFRSSTFDVAFVVEALCYSTRKEKVLAEVFHVLRGGGLFVVFDGYVAPRIEVEDETAIQLTEKGMAVPKFESYDSFVRKAKQAGFKITHEENVSSYVVPTMERFSKLASIFFGFPRLARFVAKLLPKEFAYNAVSGFLMPELVKSGLAQYMITVLKKEITK